jgi:glycine dehydrogenase
MSTFQKRHIGPDQNQTQTMLETLGYASLDDLTNTVVPKSIADDSPLDLADAVSEEQALQELREISKQNKLFTSLIGQGYYNTHTPKVILRNVLENPAWYTAYTPYQPEISQGRLEVLFYFQTMVTELTGMDYANASMLDESTAAAEAMTMCHRSFRGKKNTFLISEHCHPQTIELLKTRGEPLNFNLVMFDETKGVERWDDVFGIIVQYPNTFGDIHDLSALCEQAHEAKALVIMASDLLALTQLKSPAELGADVVVGNSQRFGVPMGFGGPHAGFFATLDKYKRSMPGRLVGESIDAHGNPAYRLALQTREQHIRREKATSNICTAQALLAMMATLYAAYHGPKGLREIAAKVRQVTATVAEVLADSSSTSVPVEVLNTQYFDTLHIKVPDAKAIQLKASSSNFNINIRDAQTITVSFDETSGLVEANTVLSWFGVAAQASLSTNQLDSSLQRSDNYLSQAFFHSYHSETDMMRYLRQMADKDLALDRTMIPLGSCTMKLNAASEMTPVTWPEFANMHPFAPADQSKGYQKMIATLEEMLCEATGYDGISLQPNAGSQGEYAGLLAIKAYHESRGEMDRDICLIPSSAHGTNPASAQMANMQVVVTKCDENGNVDLEDLAEKIAQYPDRIAAIMITYPSTHGVFEEDVTKVCEMVHTAGGQVYIDGANLNAMVGVAKPGKFGGDVSHLNLHKTFCIPHGGGGPGVGPVAVNKHLIPFLPKDGVNSDRQGALISGAPFGSAAILPISWMYIRMMGGQGLREATQVAILNANYIAHRLKDKYTVLYTGNEGLVAHECILDTRAMKDDGVSVDDIAKRLIDFGFHAPTMSFPVPGTLMIEPTESESLDELERFCRAMLTIYEEYEAVRDGKFPTENNPLTNAPHTAEFLLADDADIPYPRLQGSHPDKSMNVQNKYWPPVARIDNVHGDKNLVCSCPSLDEYQ